MAARAIWKGSISFGLVNIPVGLFSAASPDELSFRQLDRRNLSPIGYRKYNKANGEEVEGEEIVKAFEYESGHYVVLSDEDLKRANPEKTQTVEITDFVELDDIEPVYMDKPYYLGPIGKNKAATKGYALLREALKRTRKVGIAKVVIRSREYLSAVIPQGDVLVLEILRYKQEIRSADDLGVPQGELTELGINERELEMAERLVEGMTAEWNPEQYTDTYRDDLMSLIKQRIESGNTNAPDETPVEEIAAEGGDVIDIMALLKRSVEATTGRERIAADTERRPRKSKRAAAEEDEDSPAPAAAEAPAADEKPARGSRSAKGEAKPAKAPSTAASKPRGSSRKTA